jgi:hypothetical protein
MVGSFARPGDGPLSTLESVAPCCSPEANRRRKRMPMYFMFPLVCGKHFRADYIARIRLTEVSGQ